MVIPCSARWMHTPHSVSHIVHSFPPSYWILYRLHTCACNHFFFFALHLALEGVDSLSRDASLFLRSSLPPQESSWGLASLLLPSLRHSFPLVVIFSSSRHPHLLGADSLLEGAYVGVPFILEIPLSLFEAPSISRSWLPTRDASWGLDSLLMMSFCPPGLDTPRDLFCFLCASPSSRGLLRSCFPPQDAHCSWRSPFPPRSAPTLEVLFPSWPVTSFSLSKVFLSFASNQWPWQDIGGLSLRGFGTWVVTF